MMTRLRITYDGHAVTRMQQRLITRQDVQWVLAHGVYQAEATLPDAEARHSRRAVLPERHGRHEIKVVYLQRPNTLHVITVEFTDYHRD